MSLEGDFDKLAALGQKLSRVERGAVTEQLREPLEGQALDLYQRSFSQQRGPIGGSWASSPNRMYLSGELANPQVKMATNRLTVGASPYYARFHQGGWRTARGGGGPARPVLPAQSTAGTWEGPLQETIDKAVSEYFEK